MMNRGPLPLLNKLAQSLSKFVREDGVFDSADLDTIQYKFGRLLELANSVRSSDSQVLARYNKMPRLLGAIKELLELGEPEFETKMQIEELLNKVQTGVNGYIMALELEALGSDDEMPDFVYESFEPFIDPDSGECFFPENDALSSAVVSSYSNYRKESLSRARMKEEINPLIREIHRKKGELERTMAIQLSDGSLGMADAKKAKAVERENVERATKRYFEPTHRRGTEEIARVAEALYQKQHVETDLSSGALVIAASEALRSVALLKEPLEAHEMKLKWQTIPLSYRAMPSPGNRGNLFIRNLGAYGRKETNKRGSNVLDDFDKIRDYSGDDALASVLAEFISCPSKITLNMLSLPDSNKGRELLQKLQQNCFLISCAEIFRYFPVEESLSETSVKKLPFAVALSLGLELLENGLIEYEDLFDGDAPLGLPTGSLILKNREAIHEKWKNLTEKYQEYLVQLSDAAARFTAACPQGVIVRSEQDFIENLERTFGKMCL